MGDLTDYVWSLDDGLFLGFGIIVLVMFFFLLAYLIITYIFQGLALMGLAKKHNIPNPWLAWVPVGCMYLLGKLGFEIYVPEGKKNETFTWILFGLSAAALVFSDSDLAFIINVGIAVFVTWAYYNIFAKLNSKNCVLFTILTAIFSIGGILLFFNTRKSNINTVNNVKEKVDNEELEVKYCPNCGNKLKKTSNFCGKCGNHIEK